MNKGTRNKLYLAFVALLILTITAACSPAMAQRYDNPDTQVAGLIGSGSTAKSPISSVSYDNASATPTVATSSAAASTAYGAFQDTLTNLYKQVNPSVVYILVGTSVSGSGFLYSSDGYIVTNSHVATAGRTYEIVFANGYRESATLVGSDADADLAVLKVNTVPQGVKPLTLAPSDNAQVGQFVVAIGSPFGEQGSMSLGIVSGLGRSLPSQRGTGLGSTYSLPEVIQTDAPINPGNSGGPLLNLDGQVIGINAAIASSSGTNSGVGFSIPVAAVRLVVPSLIQNGSYDYSYMGASFADQLSLADMTAYGLSQTEGAYVASVTPGGPAGKAGLVAADPNTGRGGDLIISMDGQAINNFSDMNSYLVFHTHPGQTVQVTVLRGGKQVNLSLTLGSRP